MAASPATVEQLASDTVGTTDPVTALRALSALRQELDRLEPELVTRAIRIGSSWSQIAVALGISKQAAHRKYREVAEWVLDLEQADPKILVTGEARRAMLLAREEAKLLGQPAVCTEHILLGILRCEKSLAARALGELGVSHEAARDCLQTTMPGVPVGSDSQRGANRVSPHARRILEGSLREAVKRHDEHIGVEHLLLSLLSDSRNGAVQTLEMLKATPNQIRRQLELESENSETGVAEPAS
jgi:ATP-dependent Clp protease ATP-binding subunit ClpC